MKLQQSAKPSRQWPRKVRFGRVTVSIYRRPTASGNFSFTVVNYSGGKRRFDSYPTETEALEVANRLARKMSEGEVIAASMTNEQAAEYAAAVQSLAPFKVPLSVATATVAECLKSVGDLSSLLAASKFYATRHKRTEPKAVKDVLSELLMVKEGRGSSVRYLQDLRVRLSRFARAFQKHVCNITTAEVQTWLDSKKFAPRNYTNYRVVLHTFFKFAVSRGYAADNPIAGVEKIMVRGGEIEIFTPSEIERLLAAASPDFLPALAISAFAGLRSAEIERIEWSDIDLVARHIVVGASKAKTASRRLVTISENLAVWLAPFSGREGKVWAGTHDEFYEAQQETAASTAVEADVSKGIKAQKAVKWKANGLRHSYASYRFALTGDAGRVAGELGNSAAVVHRHYRELVTPATAQSWFNVKPEVPANVLAIPASTCA